MRAERLGFYLYQGTAHSLAPGSELIIVLNHLQEFSDRIDVTYSPPAIDPSQPAERKELDNTEIVTVPYPAPQDYRNALPLMPGVVQDNAGRAHFNGGQISQTNYTIDGFDISDPVTGRLETRVNIESIQAIDVVTSRFSAANGRGSAGVMNLQTRMGDDRFRFAGTNFVPSCRNRWRLAPQPVDAAPGVLRAPRERPRLVSQRPRPVLQQRRGARPSARPEPDQRIHRQQPEPVPREPDARSHSDRQLPRGTPATRATPG